MWRTGNMAGAVRAEKETSRGRRRRFAAAPSRAGPRRGIFVERERTVVAAMSDNDVIHRIEHGSPQYWATVELRSVVLRVPLGLVFSAAELAAERTSIHLACYRGEALVGCLILRPGNDGDVQMRQVAVAAAVQGQGVGTALVRHAENMARQLHYRRMILHARDVAVSFYERLGYARVGHCFEEVSIPHWSMEKPLAE
jgi:predicted GNAT family N-acyltransferase